MARQQRKCISEAFAEAGAAKIVREGGLDAMKDLIQEENVVVAKEAFRTVAILSQSGIPSVTLPL